MKEIKLWYWLALNGASVAASPTRMRWGFEVDPVPEQLIGFETLKEQQIVQEFLLTAPPPKLRRYMETLTTRIKKGEVAYSRPEHPEPPRHGPTVWLVSREDIELYEQTARNRESTNVGGAT